MEDNRKNSNCSFVGSEWIETEDHLRWFAEEGKRVYGRLIPNQVQSKRNMVVKTPIGVAGAIAPWDFPLVLASRAAGSANLEWKAWKPFWKRSIFQSAESEDCAAQ